MNLSQNQVIQFRNTALDVECLSGILWITWPDRQERILKPGQSATIISRGTICIQAFAPAVVNLAQEKKGLPGLGLDQWLHWHRFRAIRV